MAFMRFMSLKGMIIFLKQGRRRRRRRIISNEHEHEHGTVWQPILEHQIRPSAPSSVISRPTCFSSSLRCCLQVGSAPFVRCRCDCLASSAPFTNIQTYLLTYLLTYMLATLWASQLFHGLWQYLGSFCMWVQWSGDRPLLFLSVSPPGSSFEACFAILVLSGEYVLTSWDVFVHNSLLFVACCTFCALPYFYHVLMWNPHQFPLPSVIGCLWMLLVGFGVARPN